MAESEWNIYFRVLSAIGIEALSSKSRSELERTRQSFGNLYNFMNHAAIVVGAARDLTTGTEQSAVCPPTPVLFQSKAETKQEVLLFVSLHLSILPEAKTLREEFPCSV